LKASPLKLHCPIPSCLLPVHFYSVLSFSLALCLHRAETFCSCKAACAKFPFQGPYRDCKARTVGFSQQGNCWRGFVVGDLGCGRFPCSGLSAALLHHCSYFFFSHPWHLIVLRQEREGAGRGLVCGFLLQEGCFFPSLLFLALF